MADDRENDKDLIGDKWLTNWEVQSAEEWERDFNMDDTRRTSEHERSLQKLWLSFQNCASSIASLYKEGSQSSGASLWVPFQNSASSVTVLHKDSQEAVKRAFDLGCQHGGQRRTKEFLSWAHKRRRHMRREDIIAYLCGKPVPRHHQHHHHHHALPHHRSGGLSRTPTRVSVGMDRSSCSPRHSSVPVATDKHSDEETDLQPFREALALQGLNGAMSSVSVGHSGSPRAAATPATADTDDFHYYILEEMARRCDKRKRSSSTSGDAGRLDSPSRKRGRFWHRDSPGPEDRI